MTPGPKADCENCNGTGTWHDIVFDEERGCPCVSGEAMKVHAEPGRGPGVVRWMIRGYGREPMPQVYGDREEAERQLRYMNEKGDDYEIVELTERPPSETVLPSVLAGNDATFERGAVVAFLRRQAKDYADVKCLEQRDALNEMAEAIDLGEHMTPDEKDTAR